MAKYKALSLKQPWATLLVHGLKTVEVRKWATTFRGPLLIHAASKPDPRPDGWMSLPPEHLEEAHTRNGGLVGRATLAGCLQYLNVKRFTRDRLLHLNDPRWFQEPPLYGFTFADPLSLPFRPCRGWVRIFNLDLD